MVNIALLGLGTVGTGIVEILEKQNKGIQIKKILVNNLHKKRAVNIQPEILCTDFEEILNDNSIKIIVEVTSDMEKGYEYIRKSLECGKHVITASKAIVSKYFEELSQLAQNNEVAFLYEASVGGGIPVLKPLKEELEINEVLEIQGILNGTSNYILSRMVEEGMDYSSALKIAQDLGYAEADPSADVDGHDTLRKLRILGTLGLQGKILEEDILLNGISNITAFDIEQIKGMNSTVKLVGEVKNLGNAFTATVQPTIIHKNSYLANVNMAFNAINIKGNHVGDINFYGPGAGKLPTASAVLTDVMDVVNNTYRKKNPLGKRQLKNANHKIRGKFYLRVPNRKELLEQLDMVADQMISSKEHTAIVTKEVSFMALMDFVEGFGLKKEEYFLGRIFK